MSSTEGSRTLALRLALLLEDAPGVPLMRGHVRVDKEDVDALVDTIDGAVRAEPGSLSGSELLRVAAEIRDAVANAKQVPLTAQVRLALDRAAELADELRRAASR